MTDVKISDLYQTPGVRIEPLDREIARAGEDAESKAERLNGKGTDMTDSIDTSGFESQRAADLESRTHSDIAEMVVVRWLETALPDADIDAYCFENGETGEFDLTVNGHNVDVKARILAVGNNPETDLLVTKPDADRKEDIDYYLSVVVAEDASELVIQGGADRQTVRDCFYTDLTGDGTPSYIVNGLTHNHGNRDIDVPSVALDRLGQGGDL